MFLLVAAYPGCPGSKAVKRSLSLLLLPDSVNRGTMGVNSLPKTVSEQSRVCDLNPGHSASEYSTLTTRLASYPGSPGKGLLNGCLYVQYVCMYVSYAICGTLTCRRLVVSTRLTLLALLQAGSMLVWRRRAPA